MSASSPSPARARLGISLLFFTNGFALSNLLPRYPEIMQTFGLTNTQFGVLIAMYPVGALVASWLPAPLIRRFGAAPTAFGSTAVLTVAFAIIGFAPHVLIVAGAMFLAGFADAVTDAAQNVHGLLVEDYHGKSIINSLHALWSLGAVTGGTVATLAASQHVPLAVHLISATLVGLAIAGLAVWLSRLPDEFHARRKQESDHPASTRLTKAMWLAIIPLALLAIVGVLPEEVAMNWAALYLVQIVDTPIGIAGVGFVVMIGAQTVGRFLGDLATDRWGVVPVMRAGGALIALGGVLVIAFPVLPVVLLGFALAGYGCATVVPAAYAAAGRLPGLPEGAGVTIASWLLRVGFLGASPFIGLVSDFTSLRVALVLLAVSGFAVLALSGRAAPPVRAGAPR